MHVVAGTETAVFGGGCFWCTEAIFKMLRGVSSVLPGYAGGITEHPTYTEVAHGKTGHAEVVQITFDPTQRTYHDLLTVFFASHDPTTLNRQGVDSGTQYRSIIFYTTQRQRKEAEDFISELNESTKEGRRIVTELAPLEKFYEAEHYHRDYFATHQDSPYCELVINPKLEKVRHAFTELLNAHSA